MNAIWYIAFFLSFWTVSVQLFISFYI